MRSMFQVGFERQIFSDRHPEMGVSFNEIQTWWKANYPALKTNLKTVSSTPVPGTVPIAPSGPRVVTTPTPSSAASTALMVGGLAAAGLAAYYFLARRPFGIRK